MALYITAPPAAVPMSARRSRLRMFVASRSDIIWLPGKSEDEGYSPASGAAMACAIHRQISNEERERHDCGGAAHAEAPAFLDAGHRLEPCLHAGQAPPDGAELVEHRGVEGERRRGLGDAAALEDAQPELLNIGAARRLLHGLGAGHDVAQR